MVAFYVIYGCCGITDFLDGTIARAVNATSKFGSRLDSVADIMFLGVMGYKFIPYCIGKLQLANWILILAATAIHLAAYIVCLARFHKMSTLHTFANKVMSALIFVFPFTLVGDIEPLYIWYAYIGGVIAIYSAIECLLIHCVAKRYNPKNQMIWLVNKNEREYLAEHPELEK